MELALGRDPVVCRWNSNRMRQHLKSCLKKDSFPILGMRRIIVLGHEFGARYWKKVYCIPVCRMTNDKEKATISFDKCHGWFHYNCVNLNKEESFSDKKWSGENCQTFFAKLTVNTIHLTYTSDYNLCIQF